MSLNKFFDTNTGYDVLKMNIGADEVKCNNIDTTNINTSTINGVPPVGGVSNPLTENLKLGGFAIVEEIGLSPSLNIDQLDNTKDIKLKIDGISKVDVKNNEIQLNENLNMNNNNIVNVSNVNSGNALLLGNTINDDEVAINPNINSGVVAYASLGKKVSIVADAGNNTIDVEPTKTTFKQNIDMSGKELKNVSVIDNSSGNLQLIGQSSQSAIELDPNGVDGVNINANTKNINIIASSDLLLKSTSSFLDLDSNLIRFLNAGVPAGQIDAVGGWELVNTLNMTNNNIISVNELTGNKVNADNIDSQLGGDITINKNINMNNNNIDNVPQVSNSAGVLNLLGNGRTDIGITAGGGRLEVEDTRIYISSFADLNIHNQVIWVRPDTMPTFFIGETTYIFVGSRNTANSYTLPDNCKICGLGKNNSFINYNGGGSLFTTTDANISICDITLTSSNNAGILLTASNVAKNKTINFTGLQIRNSKNVMDITGYDLIDFNNCIFTYIETGSVSPIGVKITDASKVQLSSTEFLRWFQEGGTPNLTAFTGNMLEFVNVLNALNVNGCFFHPQYNQNGIDLSAVSSVIEGTISSNTFIDINLNTPTYNVLNILPTIASSYVIEANSIYPNLKSQMTYILTAVNTTPTDLSINNPNVINHNNLALPLVAQFATITTGGLITYTKKRSSNFMIVATCNIELVAGTNNRIGLGLFLNGSEVPLAYSYVNLSASGSANQKSCTLSFTGQANLNDTFQLSVYNATASNNVIVSDINFAGIEI
jgi:hypothetical protein